ncbi:C4-dicarboxylate TRAP transporter large permease protein DctM [subsurface metagenome]
MLITSLVPPMILVLSVLGVIYLGIAPPTEAAAAGAVAATLLVIAYHRFNWQVIWQIMKDVTQLTLRVSSMIYLIGGCALGLVAVFLGAGCGQVVEELILAAPGGRWGAFIAIMFIMFLLGFFITMVGILFIMIPIITPLAPVLGFDPLWFAMMICVNLQMSFMTPPFAYAIFYVRGAADPELGVTTTDIIRGVTPFVILIMAGLGILVAFPEIILWLPSTMIK